MDGGGDGGRGAVDPDLRDGLGAVRADLVVTRYQEGPKIARNVANLGRAIALQIPGQRNALAVVADLLGQGVADGPHGRPVDLAERQLRVDGGAAVEQGVELVEPDLAGSDVDSHLGEVGPIREGKLRGDVAGGAHEDTEAGTGLGLVGQLGEGHLPQLAAHHARERQLNIGYRLAQHGGAVEQDLLLEVLGRLLGRVAGEAGT